MIFLYLLFFIKNRVQVASRRSKETNGSLSETLENILCYLSYDVYTDVRSCNNIEMKAKCQEGRYYIIHHAN